MRAESSAIATTSVVRSSAGRTIGADGMGAPSAASTDVLRRDALDLDQRTAWDGLYRDRGARRVRLWHAGRVHLVDRVEVGHVGEIDRRLQHGIEARTGGAKDGVEVLEDALCLGRGVARHQLAGGRIDTDLPGGEDERLGGH